MRSLVFDSIWAFQPIVDVLRPQSHGVGRALLGMSSPTLREVPNRKSACPQAQFELLPAIYGSQNLIKKISSSSKSKNRPIFERGTTSDYFSRIMHRGQKLELRLWRNGFLSWGPLGETMDWFRELYG